MSKQKKCLLWFSLLCAHGLFSIQQSLQKVTEKFVHDAVEYFNANTFGNACFAFVHHEKWYRGPISLFIYDDSDISYFSQVNPEFAGLSQTRGFTDIFGNPLGSTLLETAKKGGWVSYPYYNSMRHSYVKTVEKNHRTYILGAGYFSENPYVICPMLLDAVMYRWNKSANSSDLFNLATNPVGPLVFAGLYPVIVDLEGICVAHGDNSSLIGQNLLNPDFGYATTIKMLLQKIKKNKNGTIKIPKNNMSEHVCYSTFSDKFSKKEYIIFISFFPDLDQESVIKTANGVESILKKNTKQNAIDVLNGTNRQPLPLLGNLNALVTDTNGMVLAYTKKQYASFIGRNIFDLADAKGIFFTRLLQEKIAKNGKGWVSRFERNSMSRMYGKQVTTNHGNYLLFITDYFPYQEKELTAILTDDAYNYIVRNPDPKNFDTFTDPESAYLKGNIRISVIDTAGYFWLHRFHKSRIWTTDDKLLYGKKPWIRDERSKSRSYMYYRIYANRLIPDIDVNFIIAGSYYAL